MYTICLPCTSQLHLHVTDIEERIHVRCVTSFAMVDEQFGKEIVLCGQFLISVEAWTLYSFLPLTTGCAEFTHRCIIIPDDVRGWRYVSDKKLLQIQHAVISICEGQCEVMGGRTKVEDELWEGLCVEVMLENILLLGHVGTQRMRMRRRTHWMCQIYHGLSRHKHGNILNGYCHLVACAMVQSAYTSCARPIYYSVNGQFRIHSVIVKMCLKANRFMFDFMALESRSQKVDKRFATTLAIGVAEDSNAGDVPLHYVIRETLSGRDYWTKVTQARDHAWHRVFSCDIPPAGEAWEMAATLMVLCEERKAALFIRFRVNAFSDVIVQCFKR